MNQSNAHFAIVKAVQGSFDDTVAAITQALKEQGFGILTQIDVRETLKQKLGVDHPRTLILGACNPPLAHRAMSTVPDVATLLPCNVVVRESAGGVEIAALNPLAMGRMVTDGSLDEIAAEADRRIRLALAAVA